MFKNSIPIILRGNLRVLTEKLRFLSKLGLLSKPRTFVPLILFAALLLFVGIFALTQESPDDIDQSGLDQTDSFTDDPHGAFDFFAEEGGQYSEWIPPGPPRWFLSNAGGMTIEETHSRLAALRNKYALVIDYISPREIEPRLLPYYQDNYSVEIRILYEEGFETRRQWLFHDETGITRLNAVFRHMPDILPDEIIDAEDMEDDPALADTALTDNDLTIADHMPDMDSPHTASLISETALSVGFIERYNDTARIIEDRWFFDDDSVIMITYSYNGGLLLKAETRKMLSGSDFKAVYADYYRYNRSFSLRNIERVYYEGSVTEPVRLTFPGRVLEAAADVNFIGEKLSVAADFMGNFFVGEGFRVIYDTDNRGRVISQTMIDKSNEIVWVLKNTWAGDRIVSSLKTEGDDVKLTEYEYNDSGERIVQRDMHNGVLERVVYTKGANETEELYMNGVLVLKAYWEDGR
jgi:hypothetical protein